MKTSRILSLHFHLRKPGSVLPASAKWVCLVIFFILTGLSEIHAQQVTDYSIQANIIYRFTKYIDWPVSKKSGDFIIGIVGETPLADELKGFIANKTAGSQKIVIKKFSASTESYNCHILFISEDESSSLKKIAARTAGNAILIVSESEGLALRGACINFIIVSDHLKLEINKTNIEQRNLSIASELLQLGKVVK
jgi:YfiR/HmsC-like